MIVGPGQTRVAEDNSAPQPTHRQLLGHSPLFVCAVALLLRLLTMGIGHSWPLDRTSGLWKSSPEVVNIASSLVGKRGFSSPFGIESGPTAWLPPVYPAVVAAAFVVLGERSNAAALAILSLQALLSALTCIPLYAIAKQAFDEKCAVWAAWGWALSPYAVLIPELFVWETSLSGFLLVLLCYLSLNLSRYDRWNQTLVGFAFGIAALTNTALLALMPVFLFAHPLERPAGFPYKKIAVVALGAALVVCPWILRTWLVLGAVVPVRSNFGEELWVGNHAGGSGRIEFGLGPADNLTEREHYRSMGEISYVAQRRAQAVRFIWESPGRFLRRGFYRFGYWWFAQGETGPLFALYRVLTVLSFVGIALALPRMGNAAVLAILGSIVTYPLIYCITDVYARHRYPIEPLLMCLSAFAVSRPFLKRRARTQDT